jgi:predicted SnoaL-like aldol condensation-catalyzing enzyme
LVLDFFDKVLLGGDLSLADQYLRADYIQHNPQIPGGRDGFVSYFTDLNNRLEQLNATISGEIEHVIAEGDKVMVVVAYEVKGPIALKFRAADLFRVQDGLIAEHWDVRQGETLRDHQILMQN